MTFRQQLSLKNKCVEFMFAYQQRNVEKMIGLCSPEGNVHFVPLGEAGEGRIGELGKTVWSALIDCFPDIDNTIDMAIAEEREAGTVRCQVLIRGTQGKDFFDIPTKGLRFDSDHIFIFRLNADLKIDDIRISWDHNDFKRQLGSGIC